MRLRALGFGLVALAVLAACGDNRAAPPIDAGPDAGERPQGSLATSDLVLNEVSPRGDGADWIELMNRGASPIDLCGVFLTDSVDRLDHYLPLGGVMPPATCEPRELAPGAYLVITMDDTPIVEGAPIDPAHAPFKLALADEVHLVEATTGAVIDGLLYLYPPGPNGAASVTMARVPDGSGQFYTRQPTPSAANPETLN